MSIHQLPVTKEVRKVLQLRLAVSQAATKKFQRIANVQVDGRIQDTLQAWGAARTGRWAARHVQSHNLKRSPEGAEQMAETLAKYPDLFRNLNTLEDLGNLVRSAITAPPGKMLVVVDLSSIESRVLGWLAGATSLNQVFARGDDTYVDFASKWLGIPYEDVTKAQRKLAKPAVLGCGYGLGAKGLVKYAESMGVEMDEDEAKGAVDNFRNVYSEVPALWKECLFAASEACNGGTWEGKGLIWTKEKDFLTVRLPSGRKLYYHKPKWEEVEVPWGETQYGLTYMGQDQYTRKWERQQTHGGKIVENLVQAIARDILVSGMLLYTQRGGTIVGHVHDEAIAEEDEVHAETALDYLNICLSTTPAWAPGLILESHGYIARRYR